MQTERKLFIEGLPARLQAGEEQAFVDFSDEFSAIFYLFFLSRGLPQFEAQDLAATCVVDIPLKVVDGKYKPAPDATFYAWVWKVIRTCASDWWRKQRGYRPEPLPEDLAEEEEVQTPPDVARAEAVREAIWQLPSGQRQVIEHYYSGGASTFKEVGASLHISEQNARTRHCRALQQLEKILQEDPRIHLRGMPVGGKK